MTDETKDHRKYVPFLDRHYNLYTLIYLTHTALFNTRYQEIKGLGITSMELGLLTVVHGLGGSATPAEISRWMMRKRPTVSGLLNRMERNGLITRSGYKHNRKLKKVSMTARGRRALQQAYRTDVMHTIMGALSDEDFNQLWSLLERLRTKALELAEKLDKRTTVL